jgi:HK97 family phage major capsid protein
MTLLELKDKQNVIKRQMTSIITKGKSEKRTLTKKEASQVNDYISQIEKIDKQIEDKGKELRTLEKKENKQMDFSLIKSINAVVNNRSFDEDEQSVIEQGQTEMRKAGQSYSGQIVLPLEYRANVQATIVGAGIENVPEDKLGIVEALRNKLVMIEAGCNFMTGLIGDVSIPVYSGSNVSWVGEVAPALDGAGTFSEVLLQPKRLTAYLNVSK